MLGSQTGVGNRPGTNGIGQFGQNGLGVNNNQTDMKSMKDLLQQILDMMKSGQTQAPQQAPQQAQGGGGAKNDANNAADDGNDLEKMFRKLQELAAQNPQALAQVLKQNPGLMQVAQAALSGGGGGGSVGAVGGHH